MQQLILRKRKLITLLNGSAIALGVLSLWILRSQMAFEIALIFASLIGVLPIAIQAFQALRVKVVSIDVLVTVAVIGAFLIRNFEESAIVTFLFLFGAFLEARTLDKTRSAVKALTEMAPETALRLTQGGEFEEVEVDDVDVDDILLVKTGAKVPVDGIVISGEGSMDEASITGESIPVAKEAGSRVFASSILDNGTIQIRAERVGVDSTFGRIIELVEEAQDSKSAAERFIDRFSRYYTPAVLGLALIIGIISQNVELAITILVLGCPGALVIGAPVSNVAGIGNGARQGILLKGSEVVSDFSRLHTMALDKTGTLTLGRPSVSELRHYGAKASADDKDLVLSYLASVERESEHPLARAVLEHIGETSYHEVTETEVIKGEGILAKIKGKKIALGNMALMRREKVPLDDQVLDDAKVLEQAGNSLIYMALAGKLRTLVAVKDQIRPGVKEDLALLRKLGVRNLVMLSGDNQGAVDAVSRELGLSEARGNMLPEDKAAYIRRLQDEGKIVAFVGDGVNDSPSLARAHIGIAMGSGTDVAIETSDVVLMNSDFGRLPHALGLSKAISRNMKQNIIIAVGVVLVLLASLIFSEWMNMSIGMLVHEASILVVILNGMRLLRYRLPAQGPSQKVQKLPRIPAGKER